MVWRSGNSLVEGSVGRALLSLSWPILCSGLLGVLDASVNAVWVGRELGDVAFAALANANLLWALLFAAAFGVSMAGAVQIGRSLGAGDIPSAKAAIGATVFACALVSVLCIVPMVVGAREMLELLGTPTVS